MAFGNTPCDSISALYTEKIHSRNSAVYISISVCHIGVGKSVERCKIDEKKNVRKHFYAPFVCDPIQFFSFYLFFLVEVVSKPKNRNGTFFHSRQHNLRYNFLSFVHPRHRFSISFLKVSVCVCFSFADFICHLCICIRLHPFYYSYIPIIPLTCLSHDTFFVVFFSTFRLRLTFVRAL